MSIYREVDCLSTELNNIYYKLNGLINNSGYYDIYIWTDHVLALGYLAGDWHKIFGIKYRTCYIKLVFSYLVLFVLLQFFLSKVIYRTKTCDVFTCHKYT